jgi:predicted methyltransferase
VREAAGGRNPEIGLPGDSPCAGASAISCELVSMLRAVAYSHRLLREHLVPGDMTIDATAGNGHDTLFLARLTGTEGMVFAFDVQASALEATRALMEREGIPPDRWRLLHAGHETMADRIPAEWHGRVGAVLFNLGYLPGSDKTITTAAPSTVEAMKAALPMLRPGGILVAVLYVGHPGGGEEARAVLEFASSLPFGYHATEYRTLNSRKPSPSVLAIEKT